MSSQLPKVTVIIPNFNHEEYILDAVNSVYKQDYPELSIFIVDDHSTDGSWKMLCKTFGFDEAEDVISSNNFGRIISGVRLSKNCGPSTARNIAIRNSDAHILGFLDADDVYKPEKVSRSVLEFIRNPDYVGAVYSDYDIYHVNKNLLIREFKHPFSREMLQRECIVNNDSFVSRLAFEVCGLYDEEMRTCEDYDLWMRISEKFMITHIPDSLVTIRVTGKNSTDTVSKPDWERNWRRVMMKARERLKQQ